MMSRADTREPERRKLIFRRAGWQIIKLDYGDYDFPDSMGKLVVIEYKMIEQMVTDMHSGVLTRQCRNLCENSDFPILMVSGHWAQKDGSLLGSGISWKQAWNQLQTIQDMGCRLRLATSEQHAVETVFQLEEYYSKESHPSALRQPSGNPYITMLSLINGIGLSKAKELEKVFPTIEILAQADIGDIEEANGVGGMLASRIWWFIRGRYA